MSTAMRSEFKREILPSCKQPNERVFDNECFVQKICRHLEILKPRETGRAGARREPPQQSMQFFSSLPFCRVFVPYYDQRATTDTTNRHPGNRLKLRAVEGVPLLRSLTASCFQVIMCPDRHTQRR